MSVTNCYEEQIFAAYTTQNTLISMLNIDKGKVWDNNRQTYGKTEDGKVPLRRNVKRLGKCKKRRNRSQIYLFNMRYKEYKSTFKFKSINERPL